MVPGPITSRVSVKVCRSQLEADATDASAGSRSRSRSVSRPRTNNNKGGDVVPLQRRLFLRV